MLAQTPPMGWNTWNTFARNINEQLIRETADAMVDLGYRDAGYEYVIIDDCWSEPERDANDRLVASHEKFPSGIKALADYVHGKGLKLGLYSDAGVRTCGGFPGSFDHEYEDARQFAEWGVDYLKYDFCNFPDSADNTTRYLTMSMALHACGREILFSACNWGRREPWNWMRSVGAHMYRSDTDIRATYPSMADIIRNQCKNLNANAAGCFNDLDMLTVGMPHDRLLVTAPPCTETEYTTEFAFWCMASSPLIMGSDIRATEEKYRLLLQHKGLIAINQDPLCRPPFLAKGTFWDESGNRDTYILLKFLSGGEFALGFFNLNDAARGMECIFADCGISYRADRAVRLTDVLTGETLGIRKDEIRLSVPAHGCRVLRGKVVTL